MTDEEIHDFAMRHAPELAKGMTELCGKVLVKGLTGILHQACIVKLERDRLEAAAREALPALEKAMGAWGGTCAWHADVERAIKAIRFALTLTTHD